MLAKGGSLAEIGQVLRHRRPHTTATHTKVNVEALRTHARSPMARLGMTRLRPALTDYLDLRRGLGFKAGPRRQAAGPVHHLPGRTQD